MKDKEKEKGEVSRRDFLVGAGAVVVGGAIGAGIAIPLAGKGDGEVTTKTVEVTKTVSVAGPTVTTTVGEGDVITSTVTETVGGDGATVTKTVTSTTTVGGDGGVPPALEPETTVYKRCSPGMAAYDSKHGKIIRGRPVHYDALQPEIKPYTFTARGKTLTISPQGFPSPQTIAYRKRIDSPCKALYPMQRVDWEPGGDPAKMNTQNRGISKFKRISWEEVSAIIASELKRVADTYGPEAVCHNSFSMGENNNISGRKGDQDALLDYWCLANYGAFPSLVDSETASFVGGAWGGVHVWGKQLGKDDGYEEGDLIRSVCDNTEMYVVWPGDIVAKVFGKHDGLLMSIFSRFLKTVGIKIVHVDPVMNMGAGTLADKWIPVLPNTDCAFHLAIAYTWITEDTYDKEYVESHTVGFDEWKAYVMGDEDGVPKTPAWASPLCGVPVWTIKALAREWASHVTTFGHGRQGGGVCRAPYSTEPTRMGIYLLGMQGVGKPGVHQLRTGRTLYGHLGAARSPSTGSVSGGRHLAAVISDEFGPEVISEADRDRQLFPQREAAKAILDPPCYMWGRRSQEVRVEYPMEGKSEIHLLWSGGASWLGGDSGGNLKFQAFRSPKIECHIAQCQFIEEAPYYADIILPVLSQMEHPDIQSVKDTCHVLAVSQPACEPRGEAKTDLGGVLEVARALGIYDKFMGEEGEAQFYQNQLKTGWEKCRWDELVSYETITEVGVFAQPTREDWEEGIREPMKDFYNDPEANPLSTPTGKFEFESQFLKEWFPDDNERLPVAHYVRGGPASEGWTHDEDRFGERGKLYPLLCIADVYEFAEHSMHGDIPWTREITKMICWDGYNYERVWIHPETAAARDIKQGDLIRYYNDRGSVLGAAYVTEEAMPGMIRTVKARQCDYIIPAEVNRAGSPNSICPDFVSRHVRMSTAYNGYLVELEKVTGEQMDEWRKNYPDAFARDYNPDYGALTSGWMQEGGM